VLSVFVVTFPFFALVLCGWLATRARMLPLPAIAGLNVFVLYFALPCMLYRVAANTPMTQLLNGMVAGIYLLCTLLLVGGIVWFTRRGGMGWNDAAFGALVTVFPNTGFMGVPLLLELLGEASAGPAVVLMMVDMVITSSLCVALSRLDSGQGGAVLALRGACRGMAANPMPWAVVLGGLASAMQWRFPVPLEQLLAMLANAASPVALFAIGAVLARSQMNQQEHVAARLYVPLALTKLALHPLLVWCAGRTAQLLGMPLSPLALQAMVLVAALPSASNVALLAERFDAHGGRVARVILVSTALAFVSFAAVVVWVV